MSAADAELIVATEGRLGRLRLNRPGALGALTVGMCRAMIEALLAWRDDPGVEAVLIDHAGERGFCAGGDIRFLAESGARDGAGARDFFFTEYRLNHLIFGYPKPVITVMDGVTMGGGAGISWGADYRIGTERTTFAMPETGIGLFPDVGGSWFLPRLHGGAGAWLALTGARLKAAGCEILGIVTDVLPSSSLADFKARLAEDPGGGGDPAHRTAGRPRPLGHDRAPRRDRPPVPRRYGRRHRRRSRGGRVRLGAGPARHHRREVARPA